MGTPVDANMLWLNGSDVALPQAFVASGSSQESSLNDGKFAFSYNLFSSYTGTPSAQLLVNDPSFSGLTTASGSQVTMLNPNYLQNTGGGNLTVHDSAKIVCDGKGGFAFAEVSWTNVAPSPPTTDIPVGYQDPTGSYRIWMYAPDPQSVVSSTNPLPVTFVQLYDAQNNFINSSIRRIDITYWGDVNNGYHTIGTITLSNNNVINVDSYIGPS